MQFHNANHAGKTATHFTRLARRANRVGALIIAACVSSPALGQMIVRVVDVGAGLCCIIKTSDDHYMVYDAGNYKDNGDTAMTAIEQMIPVDSTIDLLVLSHCDADHIAAVPFICENYKVKEVWRDGFDPGTAIWAREDDAIDDEVADDECEDNNLQEVEIEPGHSVQIGNATVTFLCGFADVPDEWGSLSEGEVKNSRSIVVRVDFGAASILFAGDTVGRHIGDPWNTNIAAERELVDNVDDVPIDVNVLVAPHHGADNGSSYPFILATSPEYVIFSSGSHFHHPHYWTANRYTTSGVSQSKMFRTDRNDNEGSPEWSFEQGDEADPAGDDDVLVTLQSSGAVNVDYVPPLGLFETRTAMIDGVERTQVVKARSARVAKWADNEALWQEDFDHEEDHTIPPQSLLTSSGRQEGDGAHLSGRQNRPPRAWRRGLFRRRFR